MDRDNSYRMIVKRVLQEVAEMMPSEPDIRTEFVCDDALDHYQVGIDLLDHIMLGDSRFASL